MNSQQTWNRFDENACFYWEMNFTGSIMRICIVLAFVLTVVNSFNTQVTGRIQTTTGIPSFIITQGTTYSRNDVAEDSNEGIGGVFNVHIEPEYNSTRNKIILNVSWDQPINDSSVNHYDFKITPNSSYYECNHEEFKIMKRNKTWTNMRLPPDLYRYEIFPGCTYIISVITNRANNRRFQNDIVYTVPECVGNKCSCKYLNPEVNNISVIEYSPGSLNISWEINREGANETIFNITKILLEYRSKSNRVPFNKLASLNIVDHDYFVEHEAYKIFTPGELYELQATFYNIFECKVINYTNFSLIAAEAFHDIGSKGLSWEIILLIVCFSLTTFLFGLYMMRRNRLILKEIICHAFSLKITRTQNYDDERPYVIIPSTIKREEEMNPLYVEKEILEGTADQYEFPRARIHFIKYLKSGEFGQVFKAKALNIDNKPGYSIVAVKSIREGAPEGEREEFLIEVDIVKRLGEHPNIVKIFGCCQLKEPYLIIMEYISCGDLHNYLLDLREKWKKQTKDDRSPVFLETTSGAYIFPNTPRNRMISEGPSLAETESTNLGSDGYPTPTESCISKVESSLDHNELQDFALQIAKGMEHLEKIGIVHRDLAARNILINEFKTLKITDFGMSRISPYINHKGDRVPLRWVALEAIENKFYDSKGDVWSFAVVLWEIGTLGAFPYGLIENDKLLRYLQSGERLERPEVCTDELYSLMLRCWSREIHLRPSFEELVQQLGSRKKHIYVDFSQLNPLYMFPPTKD